MTDEYKRPLSTAELISVLEEDDDLITANMIDAVYIPPTVDEMTDEENIDDDLLDEKDTDADIAGTIEIHTHTEHEEVTVSREEEPGTSAKRKKRDGGKKKTECIPNWKKVEPSYTSSPLSEELGEEEEIKNTMSGRSPFEVFSLYFDVDVLSKIVEYTNKYAQDNNRHSFKIDISLLKKFMGIMILSGYHTLPAIKLYWSKDEDKGLSLVRKCMSRNTFLSIKQNIHLSDNNNLDQNDKFAKLRPIFDIINEKYLQFGIFSHNLSIDEEMVPYFGRHSCKMFMRGKPVRFGFKLWCLCSSNGYLFKFIPYGGKMAGREKSEFNLGEEVVLNLLSVVDYPSRYCIYFDNFFSSYNLFRILKQKGFFATGTIRENRTAKCPLQTISTMKKKEKAVFDFAFEEESEVMMVRWNDNSVVTVASNNGTIHPLANAKRYNRKEKKNVSVPQPNVMAQYNKYMGGVDLHDNAIANYRIRIRGKKWWWPLFTNLIDSAIVNSWKIYNTANEEKMSQLDFRSYLVMTLMKSEECSNASVNTEETKKFHFGRPSNNFLPKEVRFDDVGHVIIEEENKARRRCRMCKSTTIYKCKKCNVHLHSNCFQSFHDKIN